MLTPQLRQALHLLQLSALELEAEITTAVESNPLLDWDESAHDDGAGEHDGASHPEATHSSGDDDLAHDGAGDDWSSGDAWYSSGGGAGGGGGGGNDDTDDPTERVAQSQSLREYLSWQLNLSQLSERDLRIGEAVIDAIDDDGYLRACFDDISQALQPDISCKHTDIASVLSQVQRLDPAGVGARDLRECLCLQLDALADDTPARELARRIASELIEELPRLGESGLAQALGCRPDDASAALQLLRSLDPRPGAQVGSIPSSAYVTPDCAITRQGGVWRVSLVSGPHSRLTIHRGYESMIRDASQADASYLRGRLQEARWLLRNVEARGETLLKVVNCLVREQSGYLEFGPQALRPLTLREVAASIGMHESTVSRAVAGKYVRTPRGTLPLRSFFASGVDTGTGGQASSTAIQQMIRKLVESEDPRKPLSDARLASELKAAGVPVARRTVAKYREALNIPSSHERVRLA